MGGLLSCSFGEWLGAGSGLTGGEEGGGEDDVAGVDFGDVEGIEEGLAVAFAGDGDGGAIAEDGADVAVVVRGRRSVWARSMAPFWKGLLGSQ